MISSPSPRMASLEVTPSFCILSAWPGARGVAGAGNGCSLPRVSPSSGGAARSATPSMVQEEQGCRGLEAQIVSQPANCHSESRFPPQENSQQYLLIDLPRGAKVQI